eukprot:scaffold270458_cov18-Tisochrysis_lutea.AAC.1
MQRDAWQKGMKSKYEVLCSNRFGMNAGGSFAGDAPEQGCGNGAGGLPNRSLPSQARETHAGGGSSGDVLSSHQPCSVQEMAEQCAGDGGANSIFNNHHPCSVQEMVEQLLQENAKLLQRLG